METLIDIGKSIITGKYGFHIQSMVSETNELTIHLLQDYGDEINQYRLDFGEIFYFEYIDEHISALRFLDKSVFEGVVFEVLDSCLLQDLELQNCSNESFHHYYIRLDLYYIDVVSSKTLKIEKIDLDSDRGYIL